MAIAIPALAKKNILLKSLLVFADTMIPATQLVRNPESTPPV
eukprot:CAMPEP_0202435068 /NCGR_PEP_ID=MMETSP1345-20130828/17584_1 /ASSEMBLY_ACC=CAM_ASM_000843 /TAXON_ID=342563 /ORGANISM="Fabrea Fabrea salina" /LENGTH=41 /DNA_ID= /DNA_START= /DNA_END= /DNA_ORIENTATION=